ncbi:hypothetical protein HY230_10885 [Candidatus Acetothermia bacterium]|nr:hypothetical protein [Candidatus Acetothermia bacterium]
MRQILHKGGKLLLFTGFALVFTLVISGRVSSAQGGETPTSKGEGVFVILSEIQGQFVPGLREKFVLAQFPNGQFQLLDNTISTDSRLSQRYTYTLQLDSQLQPLSYTSNADTDIANLKQALALVYFAGSKITATLSRSLGEAPKVFSFPLEPLTAISDLNALAQDWLWVRVVNEKLANQQRFKVNLLVPLEGQRFPVDVSRGSATIVSQGKSVQIAALRASAGGAATLLLAQQGELIGEAVPDRSGWRVIAYREDLYPQGFAVKEAVF